MTAPSVPNVTVVQPVQPVYNDLANVCPSCGEWGFGPLHPPCGCDDRDALDGEIAKGLHMAPLPNDEETEEC